VARKVDAEGKISTVAGVPGPWTHGFAGEGGPAVSAQLDYPGELAVAPDGTLYISDTGRLVAVSPDGILSRVMGGGFHEEYPALQAGSGGTYTPLAIFPDGSLVAVHFNQIRKIMPVMPGARVSDLVIADPSGTQAYVFDSTGRHLRTVDTLTKAVLWQFAYDTKGRLASIGDVDGNVTTIERSSTGEPTAIVGPYGQRTTLAVDGSGFLGSITDPATAKTSFTYSSTGLLASMTDARTKTWSFTYDATGRLMRDDDPALGYKTLSSTFGTSSWQVDLTTKLGITKKFKTERFGDGSEVRTYTAPSGLVTTSTQKQDGSTDLLRPTGMRRTSTLAPDPRFGMLTPLHATQTSSPAGLSQTTAFTRTATLASPTDPFSVTSLVDTTTINAGTPTSGLFTNTFTASTLTWSSLTAAGRTSSTVLTDKSKVSKTTFDGFLPVSYGYDGRGRLTTITQGTRVTAFGYDTDGFLASVTDPLLRTTTFEHDAVGRVTKQIFPDLREVSMGYDAVGNVTSVTPPGRPAHGMAYTPVSLMASYDPPALADVTAPSTTYQYDADRKVTKINRPDGVAVVFGYDAAARRQTITHPHDTVTFAYDATKGTLTGVSTPSVAMTYGYDGSLRTSTAWSGAIAGSVAHAFDARFRVIGETVNGSASASFGYDADGLLTSAGLMTLTRSPTSGLVTGTTLGVVTDAVTYTTFAELESRTTMVSGSDLLKISYTRDALGRIETKTEVEAGLSTAYGYKYDLVGRLIEVKKNGTVTATYEYDSNGNRLKKIAVGGTETGTYDAQDRMLTYGGASYTYNANGDLATKTDSAGTTTYEYDALGNLRKVTMPSGTVISYVIDGANRRVAKRVGGVLVQQWLYSSDLRIVAELDGTGAIVSRFVYGTRVNVPEYIVKGASTYRVVTDHLGSVRRVVDTATGTVVQKTEYDEYGVVLSDTAPGFQPFGFAGGLVDASTGMVRFGKRDYMPTNGRWTVIDPIRFRAKQTNLYGYVANDPINAFDPRGKSLRGVTCALYASAVMLLCEKAGGSKLTCFEIAEAAMKHCLGDTTPPSFADSGRPCEDGARPKPIGDEGDDDDDVPLGGGGDFGGGGASDDL